MSKESKFLIELVKGASLLINDEFEVKAKDDKGDLVTNFDYEVEKYIIDKIKKSYQDFQIVSEEFNTQNELTENCFVIDPIDGTINFANKLPLWSIQVACIKNGKTCASAIYFPKLNELYYADESGAYLNDKPISVNNSDANRGLYVIEVIKGDFEGYTKMSEINKNFRSFHCASLNFAWIACGRLSATIFRKDNVWDYIPGSFLVEKAGGVIYDSTCAHIAANNIEFLNLLNEKARLSEK